MCLANMFEHVAARSVRRMGGAQRYPSLAFTLFVGYRCAPPNLPKFPAHRTPPLPCAPSRRSGAGERGFGRALFELRSGPRCVWPARASCAAPARSTPWLYGA